MKSQGQADIKRARAMPTPSGGGGPLPRAVNFTPALSPGVLPPHPKLLSSEQKEKRAQIHCCKEYRMGTAASNSGLVLAACCLATEKCTAGVNKADRIPRGNCLNEQHSAP